MTNVSIRTAEQSSPVFTTISNILMGAIVLAAGALSFVVFMSA